jgi:hypothetical protein
VDQALGVDQGDRLVHHVVRHAGVTHRDPQQAPDADPGGTRPDQHDPLIGERPAGDAQPGQHARDDHGGRALDVVIEARNAVAVSIQETEGVVLLEVLELDETAGPHLGHPGHERLDQRVVGGSAQPRRPVAQVQGIREQRRVVRPDIERHGEGQRRMDPAGGRVQRELADRDGHAAGALVTETQDPLVVGHDDQPDVVERALAQDVGDPVDVGWGDPGAPSAPDDVAELLARPADRRRVHDRQELLEVLGQQPVEERRVPILQCREPDVLLQGVVLDPDVLELQFDLLGDGQDAVGEQAVEPERLPFVGRKGQVLGQ